MSKFRAGLVGVIIFGGIGALFGGTGLIIGIILGVISGVKYEPEFGIIGSLLLNEEHKKKVDVEKESSTKNEKPASSKSNKSSTSNNPDSKIIRCPSCKKKIRVRLPLRGNKGKCATCSTSFSIEVDENGNLKASTVKNENKARKHHGSLPLSEHFKILEIEPTATPTEVKAAYRKKIREYHPDRVAGLGDKLKKVADEESKAINKAYSVIKSKGLAT